MALLQSFCQEREKRRLESIHRTQYRGSLSLSSSVSLTPTNNQSVWFERNEEKGFWRLKKLQNYWFYKHLGRWPTQSLPNLHF
jgi:hypothetical protein